MSHDKQSPCRGCQEGRVALTLLSSRSLFLAAAASSCSAASCFSFSSSWRFRTATGSPFCVACQHGVAHQWGPPPLDPCPPPHMCGIPPSAPGENSAPVSKTDPWGQPARKQGAFPPLHTSQGSAEPRRQAATMALAGLPCARCPGLCPLSLSGSR